MAPTFASVECRLDALIDATSRANDVGSPKPALLAGARRAKALTLQAEQSFGAGNARRARNLLRRAIRRLIGFEHRLRTLHAHRVVGTDTRTMLLELAGGIRHDLRLLLPGGSPGGAFVSGGA